MAAIREVKPAARFFTVELTGEELELILDGLYNVKGRYQNIPNNPESAMLFNLAQHMIEDFGATYYGPDGEKSDTPR